MKRRWITALILCSALLLTSAVSAVETRSATEDGTTLSASAATAGSPLMQAADPPGATGQPSGIGLFVLAFGGLLSALWLGAAVLSFVRAIGDMRSPARSSVRPPSNRRDGAPPADGL